MDQGCRTGQAISMETKEIHVVRDAHTVANRDALEASSTVAAPLIVIEKRLAARERSEPEAALHLRSEIALLGLLGRAEGGFVPRLVSSGEDERGPWLRTEKLAFPTLAHRLDAAGGPLDPAWIERAARAAFGALAALHEASDADGPLGAVHADLSPANVAIDDAGSSAVLLDLALACWRNAPARDGAFRGTVAYAAPEVARGEPPTPASDLFALAATLLHAALGAPPRRGPSLAALIGAAADVPVLSLPLPVSSSELAARGPGHAAIIACLAHEQRERPATAREVVSTLR